MNKNIQQVLDSILNAFESGIIPFKPFTYNIYIKHSLTGKKRRFLKDI
jgi:hypothetical protein